ncbi:MAG: hypothetical protein ACRD5G_05750 [Candidatus Acidiferrales bacterium]
MPKQKILKLLQSDIEKLYDDTELSAAIGLSEKTKDVEKISEACRELLRAGQIRRFKHDGRMVNGARNTEWLALRRRDRKEDSQQAIERRGSVEVAVRPEEGLARKDFAERAREVMNEFFGRPLKPQKIGGTKIWDYVSPDGMVVGDARWFSGAVPAARAFISEAVWLLEKVGAVQKFVVFGGEAEVPRQWLELWATLCPEDIALFYLDNKGELHEL